MEIIRKWIHKGIPQSGNVPGSSILQISDSPLLEEIMPHRFLKKFVIPSFDCYTRETDHAQLLQAYQVKMVVHSHDDPLLSTYFPPISGAWPRLALLPPITLFPEF